MNNKIKKLTFFLIFCLIVNCSFDNKTGIWSGREEEKRRALKILEDQKKDLITIYSSETVPLQKEIQATKNVSLSKPKKNVSWRMSGQNLQNFTGHIYLSGVDSNFLKKKVGKNKFKIKNSTISPLVANDSIIISDDVGNIFNINQKGKIKWKRNIYKKLYKKIYKNLSLFIDKEIIYVSDNIGFIYAIKLVSGEIIWIKNQGVPLKSNLKVFDNKIFVVNQDNKVICLDATDGSKIWDIRSISSFIKLQNFLALAISEKGDLITLSSAGDLMKIDANNGRIYWSLNATATTFAHDTDFLNSSDIVISDDSIIFFASSSIFSFNFVNGTLNWKKNILSKITPIIDGNNIFLVSNDGFFINLEKTSGETIWSTNILKILKKRKQKTEISGVIMGSGKIYVTTQNGFLIICSASTGKVEGFKKIGESITANPIITNGSLYLLTKNSRILGFK